MAESFFAFVKDAEVTNQGKVPENTKKKIPWCANVLVNNGKRQEIKSSKNLVQKRKNSGLCICAAHAQSRGHSIPHVLDA